MFFSKKDTNQESETHQKDLETPEQECEQDSCCQDQECDGEQMVSLADYDACEKELANVKEQLVRLGADFQNYKRRAEKDRQELADIVQSRVFLALLPIVDNFDRALEQAQKENVSPELTQWLSGFQMIHKELYECLKKHDVTPLEDSTIFNPEHHEALMHVDSADHESGNVVHVLQKGFTLKGKVLRPAKVSVAK